MWSYFIGLAPELNYIKLIINPSQSLVQIGDSTIGFLFLFLVSSAHPQFKITPERINYVIQF